MADENINLNVVVNGEEKIKDLAASVRSLLAANEGLAKNTKAMDARQRALGQAFGITSKGLGEHAKSLKDLRNNQRILRQESARLSQNIKTVNTNVRKLAREGNKPAADSAKEFARQLRGMQRSLNSIRPKALTNDLKSLSLAIKKAGKDAQFVGRSLIIGLTTPIVAFANRGIDALKAFDREFIRFKKIAEPTEAAVVRFDKAFLELSTRFGVSRDLIAGVTADFAELGIASEGALLGLTDVTNQVAVLGTMDVSESQQLIQTMFLGTMRSMDLMGREFESTAEKQEVALGSVRAQMFLFNAIENNTALSFRDMAIAIPEATAATTAFGLTMTQTAALLAPMKAAGIDVSTAANGLKVSLQRLVTPTGVLKDEMSRLLSTFSGSADVLGPAFENIQGTGMASIQGLIDATKELREVASDETVLQFYSKLFQKRQATRMLTSIDSLISFQDELFESTSKGTEKIREFVNVLNSSVAAASGKTGGFLPDVKDVESFTLIARIGNAQVGDMIEGMGQVTQSQINAANIARQDMRDFMSETEDGFRYIDQISSQAGKGLFVELLGAESAQQLAEDELQTALDSTSKALDRAKIAFKNIAIEILSAAEPAFKKLGDVMSNIARYFSEMSDGAKIAIMAVGAIVAGIGPLVFIVGQMQLAFGVVSGALLKLVPTMGALTAESLAATPAMLRLNAAVRTNGEAFHTSAGRFQRYIATVASGNGVMAKVANRFGLVTGILNKDITAGKDVQDLVGDPMTAAGRRLEDSLRAGVNELNIGAEAASQKIKSGSEEAKEDMIQGGVGAGKAMEASAKRVAALLSAASYKPPTPVAQLKSAKATAQAALPSAAAALPIFPSPASGVTGALPFPAAPQLGSTERDDIEKLVKDRRTDRMQARLQRRGMNYTPKQIETFRSQIESGKGPKGVGMTKAQRDEIIAANKAAQTAHARDITARQKKEKAYNDQKVANHKKAVDSIDKENRKRYKEADRQRRLDLRNRTMSPTPLGPPVPPALTRAQRIDQKMGRAGQLLNPLTAPKRMAAAGGKAVGGVTSKVTGLGRLMGTAIQAPLIAINSGFTKLTKLPIVGKLLKPFIGLGKLFITLMGPLGKIFIHLTKMIFFFRKLGTVVKMLKVGFAIFTGGILVGAIAALTPFITAVVNNFALFKQKAAPAIEALKDAFQSLKLIGVALIAPFKDFFAALSGGSSESDKVQQVANVFNTVAEFVKNAAETVRSFVVDTVAPFMSKALGAVMTLVDGFKKTIGAAIDMKNGVQGAGEKLKDGLKTIGKGIAQFFLGTVAPALVNAFAWAIKAIFSLFLTFIEKSPIIAMKLIELFVKMSPAILQVIKFMIVNAIKLFGKLVSGAGMVINKIIHLFTEMVRVVLDKLGFFGTIIEKLGGEAILKGIEVGGNVIEGLGDTLASGIDAAADGIGSLMDSAISAAEGIDTSGLAQVGADMSASIVEGLEGKREDFNTFIDGVRDSVQESLKQFEPTPIAKRLTESMTDDAAPAIADEIFEPTIETSNEAGGQAGENFAEGFKNALKDLKQEFVDLVGDFLGDEIGNVVNDLTSALEDQRDAALAVFDDQINVLDKLEKAEVALTRERQYQIDQRKLQDERELNRQNYVRNRALAIYEGRIDDARMLDREEQKSKMDSASSIKNLEQKRNDDLRKENLDFLKDSIKEAKKEADNFFKEQIAAFKEASKDITKFAPQTIEDYENQLTELTALATQFSEDNAVEFAKTFDEMQTKIVENMPNKAVTPFSYQLDELVGVAKDKYGLGTTAGDNLSVIGATLSMLDEIETNVLNNTAIETAFDGLTGDLLTTATTQGTAIESAMNGTLAGWETLISGNTGISTEWNSLVDALKTQITNTGDDGITNAIKNKGPQAVLEAAIINAEETILNKWKGTVGHIISEVDGLADLMDPMIANILEAQLAFEALEKAASAAGSAAGGATPSGSNNSGSQPLKMGNVALEHMDAVQGIAADIVRNSFTVRQLENAPSGLSYKIADAAIYFDRYIAGGNTAQASYDALKGAYQGMVLTGLKNYVKKYHPSVSLAYGGMVPGFGNQGVPAMLHGGEYVISSKAVKNIGLATLQTMNNMKFATPSRFSGGQSVTTINKSETVNIYVDNFIGEDEWFNSMVKQYDMKVRPMNDKKYNMEDRFYTTYKGASY